MKYHPLKVVTVVLFFVGFSSNILAQAAKTQYPFYIISHMANSRPSLVWAISQGANAIESDLHFDSDGNPTYFEHGGICDCICAIGDDHICHTVQSECQGSGASENAVTHMQHIASLSGVALVFIDSKVDADMGATLTKAGSAVIPFLDENLFGKGYQGKVIISSAKFDTYDYIRATAMAAKSSPNMARYFFTFDQEDNDYVGVMGMLSRFTNNRLYGTGSSSCIPKTFYSGITAAITGQLNSENSMTYIWTLDKQSSMEDYINLGVQGIMTNRVASLKNLAISMGLRIAQPSDPIPVSTNSVSSPHVCDCSYNSDGCVISMPPPMHTACKCTERVLACDGTVVSCSNPQSPYCADPDLSPGTCVLGGGNCKGYQINQSCDCQYIVKGLLKPSGCKIIKAMISNLACRCHRDSIWSCSGYPVSCDTSNPKCANPDLSKESCMLGGGNCDGY